MDRGDELGKYCTKCEWLVPYGSVWIVYKLHFWLCRGTNPDVWRKRR